jgi:NAD(P)-dependent dehydrogenase (short-subunit alcohol dehydrogenase family)
VDLELADRVTVVTGASKGIGLAIVEEMAAEGATVTAGARTTTSLEGRERVTPVAVDLAEPGGPARLVREACQREGRIDVLINNVGAAHVRTDGFLGTSEEDFDDSFRLNLFAAVAATRAALPAMVDQGGGVVINVASVNSFFEPDAAVVDYGAAEAALVNIAKSLSREFGPKGVRVTNVSPGQVATDLWLGNDGVAATLGRATGVSAEDIREQASAAIPTGRFTTPREVATIVTLLASPRTANVNGANWVIDGGLITTT